MILLFLILNNNIIIFKSICIFFFFFNQINPAALELRARGNSNNLEQWAKLCRDLLEINNNIKLLEKVSIDENFIMRPTILLSEILTKNKYFCELDETIDNDTSSNDYHQQYR